MSIDDCFSVCLDVLGEIESYSIKDLFDAFAGIQLDCDCAIGAHDLRD